MVGQGTHQLGLGLGDALDAAQALEMRRPHIGDHPYRRLSDGAQGRDLAQGIHPHLQHGAAVLGLQAGESEGQANLVIVVALALERGHPPTHDGSDCLLGRRLADATGHADDQHVGASHAPGPRQGL